MGSSRNKPCACGSGKKSKRCCGSNAGREAKLPEPGPVPQDVKDATDNMMLEEGYTSEVSARLLSINMKLRRQAMRRPSRSSLWAALGVMAIAKPVAGGVCEICERYAGHVSVCSDCGMSACDKHMSIDLCIWCSIDAEGRAAVHEMMAEG